MGMMLRYSFDKVENRRVRPPYNYKKPDYQKAKSLLEQIPDADLLAILLASCATPDNKDIIDLELWNSVVPAVISDGLHSLGEQLKGTAVKLNDKVSISQRVLFLDQLVEIFPGIRRNQRLQRRLLKVRWLTAHVLAFACGGRLPTFQEAKDAYATPEIKDTAFDSHEISEGEELLTRSEWLGVPFPLKGREFGVASFKSIPPGFFNRSMSKIIVRRVEPGRDIDPSEVRIDLDPGLVDTDPVKESTINPHPKQFATFRIVFEEA
jgi:hypothetical protein